MSKQLEQKAALKMLSKLEWQLFQNLRDYLDYLSISPHLKLLPSLLHKRSIGAINRYQFQDFLRSNIIIQTQQDVTLQDNDKLDYSAEDDLTIKRDQFYNSFIVFLKKHGRVFGSSRDMPTIEEAVINTVKIAVKYCSNINKYTHHSKEFLINSLSCFFGHNPQFCDGKDSKSSNKVNTTLYQSLIGGIRSSTFPARHIMDPDLLGQFLSINPQFADDCFTLTSRTYEKNNGPGRSSTILLPKNTTLFNHYLRHSNNNVVANLLPVLLLNLTNSELLINTDVGGKKIMSHIADLKESNKDLFVTLCNIIKEKHYDVLKSKDTENLLDIIIPPLSMSSSSVSSLTASQNSVTLP